MKITVMRKLIHVIALALLLAMQTAFANEDVVKLCGCPVPTSCPGNCAFFTIGNCQPIWKCFLEANGLFGFVVPTKMDNGDIIVNVYDDVTCQNKRFEASENGFQGSCDERCWSPEISKIGARGCGTLFEDPTEFGSGDGDAIVKICGCQDSACPGNCEVFVIDECQPFYQCLQKTNGLFAHVRPELDTDGEVVIRVYDDDKCQSERFDAIENGWKGSCREECWSAISKIGAYGCGRMDPANNGASATNGSASSTDTSPSRSNLIALGTGVFALFL